MTTHVTEDARWERHDKRDLFFLLGLPPSFLASRGFASRVTKSEEKERLLAV